MFCVLKKNERQHIFCLETHKNTTPEKFKNYLNSTEPRIQFTLEMEKNRALNFTELTIIRQDNRFDIYEGIQKRDSYKPLHQLEVKCSLSYENRQYQDPYI